VVKLVLFFYYKILKFFRGEYPLAILYFHHVFKTPNDYYPDDIDEKKFDKLVEYLSNNFQILSLEEAVHKIKAKQLPPRALVITFDDGYRDNYDVALPILKKYDCPATFFVATSGIESGVLWNDKVEQLIKSTEKKTISSIYTGKGLDISTKSQKVEAYLNITCAIKYNSHDERTKLISILQSELGPISYKRNMMNDIQLKALVEQGYSLGLHTHNHTIVSGEDEESVKQELSTNKCILENTVGKKIDFIAFPNGDFGQDFTQVHCDIASELGLKAGFSTNDGGGYYATNHFAIPRFMPYRKRLSSFALSIAKIAGEHV